MNENPEKSVKRWLIPFCAVVLVLVIIAVVFLLNRPDPVPDPTDPTDVTTEPTEPDTVPDETLPTEMLVNMAELYAQNPDTVGYIRVEGTKLDYPVMYTPDDEEKYIHMAFDGSYKYVGLPFINKDCTMDPESRNLIVYGHNMRNGTGFSTVIQYRDEKFFEEHPTIFYSTLYEEREYEVVAAFYDRVYEKNEDVFKYYEFVNYQNEEEFNEAMDYFLSKSEYDTGVEPVYGDRLLTLVTCSYHTKYGRFVVVARYPGEEPVEESVTEAE